MKKVCIFLSILTSIIAVSSCQSKLRKSSSEVDTISYAIGVMWGYQVVMDGLDFINISDAINALKTKAKEPVSAENNIYVVSAEFKEMLQKSPQRVFSLQEKKHITTLVGTIWAHQFRETQIPRLNLTYTKQGIKDMLKKDTTVLQMSIKQSSEYILKYRERIELRENQQRLEDGIAFLEENKTKDGVITTESGLQYKVINESNGRKTAIGDSAYLNVTLMQINSDTIDVSKNKAYHIGETRFVKGVLEGLLTFGEGARFTLFVPSQLGFGDRIDPWVTQKIKPNMVLIYDIEIEKLINNNSK